jgi:hypothetical protein
MQITVALGHTASAVELKSAEYLKAYLFRYLKDQVFSKVGSGGNVVRGRAGS